MNLTSIKGRDYINNQTGYALVSIVMLSYNRRNDVKEGLKELLSQSYTPIEIIVVDNGSNDGTPEMISQEFPPVKLISLESNIGVAAYNKGFQQANGKYIVILDDDSFPEAHALERMVLEFEKNEKLGVVAFDVRNYYDYKKTNVSAKSEKEKPNDWYQMAFNGAGVGVRKICIDELGGYPEEFFLYWNEQDLSIRILNAGYFIQWFPDIIALHKYSPSNRQSWRAPFFYTRNLYWLIWKYFPGLKIFLLTFQLLFNSILFAFRQKTFIYLKASFNALIHINQIKRNPVNKEIIKKLRLTFRLPFIYFK